MRHRSAQLRQRSVRRRARIREGPNLVDGACVVQSSRCSSCNIFAAPLPAGVLPLLEAMAKGRRHKRVEVLKGRESTLDHAEQMLALVGFEAISVASVESEETDRRRRSLRWAS